MPERYSYEDVFDPEREPLKKPVEAGRVQDVLGLIESELESAGDFSPKTFHEKLGSKRAEDFELLDSPAEDTLERNMLDAFYDTKRVIENSIRSNAIQQKIMQHPTLSEERRLKDEQEKLNIDLSKWQIEMMRLTLALGQSEDGKQYLGLIWDTLEKLGKGRDHDVEAFKTGIKGAVTTVKILERLGLEVALPRPEQDTVDKIDLFARTPDSQITFLVQVKSHDRPEISIKVFALDEVSISSDDKTLMDAEILIEKAHVYNRRWNRRVRPLLVDLDCLGGTRLTRDELTGIPDLTGLENTAIFEEINQVIRGEKPRA